MTRLNVKQIIKDNRGLLLFIGLMIVFRSSIADWNVVPTGSMKPTVLEGDRIWVNKIAYDLRVPLTHMSLHKRRDPSRGEIVVFDSEKADKRLVKRVIGLPGDVVELSNNQLLINGIPAVYTFRVRNGDDLDLTERLADFEHTVRFDHSIFSPYQNFSAVRVPNGHFLMMGDNRDHSADSRAIGFVPRNEIIGQATSIVMSLDYDRYYLPRMDRFFSELQ